MRDSHLFCAVAAVSVAVAPAAIAQTYAIRDLGTLPGNVHSKAFSLNSGGLVVGVSTNDLSFGPTRAFIWEDGDLADMGTLGGDEAAARSVNDAGEVAGFADIQPGMGSPSHAAFWRDALVEDLGTLGGSSSWALNVGESGEVVGGARLANGLFHPSLWADGSIEDLGVLPGHCCGDARAINSLGQIVGYSSLSQARAVLWESGELRDLGTLPNGCCSEAFDINETGQIAGFSWVDGTSGFHAVLWEGDRVADLGTLSGGANSRAYAINGAGDTVGTSWTTLVHPGDPHATLWRFAAAFDLNDAVGEIGECVLTEARDTNDAGQIVCMGANAAAGATHAFLLTPHLGLPGDIDGDGDVDVHDYELHLECTGGPGTLPSPDSTTALECLVVFDFDQDGDVDMGDFARFQREFEGAP